MIRQAKSCLNSQVVEDWFNQENYPTRLGHKQDTYYTDIRKRKRSGRMTRCMVIQ